MSARLDAFEHGGANVVWLNVTDRDFRILSNKFLPQGIGESVQSGLGGRVLAVACGGHPGDADNGADLADLGSLLFPGRVALLEK